MTLSEVSSAGQCFNLTFHGVGNPSRPLPKGEDEVWISADQFVAVLDAIDGRPDVRLSFDDGNTSDVRVALPELRSRGLRATFFVVAGRIGEPDFLNEKAIRELRDAGMTIGCHGMAHRPWRGLDDRELHQEMLEAKTILETIVGGPVTQAACPFGAYDRRVLRCLRLYGYSRAFTSDGGCADADGWLQARNSVNKGDAGNALGIPAGPTSPMSATLRWGKLAVKRWR